MRGKDEADEKKHVGKRMNMYCRNNTTNSLQYVQHTVLKSADK
jgi:hypothetical protein